MSTESLQKKTFKGLIWCGIESLANHFVGFFIGCILARLLEPKDFGLIAMYGVFTAIAGCLIGGNLATALIRKQDRTETDCCTVFYFSMGMAVVMYTAIFIGAPFIADFYNEPILCPLARLSSLTMLIGPLSTIQTMRYTVELNFKFLTKLSVFTGFLSSLVGLTCAYTGCGVWSLVIASLFGAVLQVIILYAIRPWFPTRPFSKDSFKELFGFSSKLMASRIIDVMYGQLRPLLIGKLYSGTSLGLYSRAGHYAAMPAQTFTRQLGNVCYPVLCRFGNNEAELKAKYRYIIKLAAFCVFPTMMGLCALSEPFIVLFISEKWKACIPMLQILCASSMFYPIHSLNLSILEVKGRSDYFLKLEIIKKVLGVILIAIALPFGIIPLCWSGVAMSLLCLYINTYYTAKIIDYPLLQQLADFIPSLVLSLVMSATVWFTFVYLLPLPSYFQLACGIPAGVLIYLLGAKLLRLKELSDIFTILANNLKKS